MVGKSSAYANGNENATSASSDSESDPDFISGPYVAPDNKAAPKRKRSSIATDRRKSRTKRRKTSPSSDESEETDYSEISNDSLDGVQKLSSKRTYKRLDDVSYKRVKGHAFWGSSPLENYFSQAALAQIQLNSVSDCDSESDGSELANLSNRRRAPESDEDEEEDRSSDLDRGMSPKKGYADSVQAPAIFHSQRSIDQSKGLKLHAENGSFADSETETESESDSAPVFFPKAHGKFPSNVNNSAGSGSATETEDESDFEAFVEANPKNVTKNDESAGGDTESESDEEDWLPVQLEERPNFIRGSDVQRLGPLVLDEDNDINVPASINTHLREYQRNGIKFFYEHYKEGIGGVLGDDMGLGKTIQVISFLSAIMRKHGNLKDADRRHKHVSKLQDGAEWRKHKRLPPADEKWPTCLIIAPSTVVWNWERELQTWGYFEVGVYMHGQKERAPVLKDFKIGRYDIVITSHDLARMDIEELDTLPWTCVIVDEAHKLKNPKSQITMAFHHFQTLRRLALTGTAIQNSYNELYTILDWANPDSLGRNRDWKVKVQKPLVAGQSSTANREEIALMRKVQYCLKNKLLPRFFLRRTKKLIADQLPKKYDQVVFCPLSDRQLEIYRQIVSCSRVMNILRRNEKCECGSQEERQKCHHPWEKGDIFFFMITLIKLSNHVCLVLPGPNDTAEQRKSAKRFCREIAFREEHPPAYGIATLDETFCGKWNALEILLKEWKSDVSAKNKVIIFSKSVKLLDVLEFHLSSKNYRHLRLDGNVKQEERMPMIDQFNFDAGIFCFIISTLAGGTGLNLTSANKVVIFDPNWNPAHDLQAMDRAFRFGQRRDVYVYRLLGAGSIEELIYARQVYKQQQMEIGYEGSVQTRYFEGVQDDKSKQGELFGLHNIFKLRDGEYITKMAIEKAQSADVDWALANMDAPATAPKTNRKSTGDGKEIAEEVDSLGSGSGNAVGGGLGEDAHMKGLGSLLFDDGLPSVKTEHDGIRAQFAGTGITYTHFNDELLKENEVVGAREGLAGNKKVKKSKKGKGKQKAEDGDERVWPPKRGKKQREAKGGMSGLAGLRRVREESPAERLKRRTAALAERGFQCFDTVEATNEYMAHFVSKSREEQEVLLAQLDQAFEEMGEEAEAEGE